MAEFEPPPPRPREPGPEQDPPRRESAYAPPERRFETVPRKGMSDWTPRVGAIVVLIIVVLGYVTTAQRGLRPAGFPYSMIALLALAFIQWMPVQRTGNGKILIALFSVASALMWFAVSHFQW